MPIERVQLFLATAHIFTLENFHRVPPNKKCLKVYIKNCNDHVSISSKFYSVCDSSVEHNADVLKGIEERQEDFPEQQCIFFF